MNFPKAKPTQGKKIVLIVEDEVLIRLAVADYVRDAGYQVIEASSADEALEYLQMPNSVELVFTDVRMPGSMDGLKLAQRISELYPHLLLVVASGHLLPEEADGLPFFPKPYVLAEVVDKIRTLLGDEGMDRRVTE